MKNQQSKASIGGNGGQSELGAKKSQPRFKLINSVVESPAVAEEAIPHSARTKPTASQVTKQSSMPISSLRKKST